MANSQNPPAGSHGNDTAPNKPKLDAPLSKNEPTSGPAGASYETYEARKEGQPAPQLPTPASPPKQPASLQTPPPTQHAPGTPDQRLQAILDSSFQARAASRPGRDLYDVKDTVKDLGSKAKHGLKTLTTGQIALGVGVLAAGIAFFITKKGKKRRYPNVRERRGRQPGYAGQGRRDERPWGTPSRYDRGRVQGGSGHDGRRDRPSRWR